MYMGATNDRMCLCKKYFAEHNFYSEPGNQENERHLWMEAGIITRFTYFYT